MIEQGLKANVNFGVLTRLYFTSGLCVGLLGEVCAHSRILPFVSLQQLSSS